MALYSHGPYLDLERVTAGRAVPAGAVLCLDHEDGWQAPVAVLHDARPERDALRRLRVDEERELHLYSYGPMWLWPDIVMDALRRLGVNEERELHVCTHGL